MHTLNNDEVQQVSGGTSRDMVTSATIAGAGRIGAYVAAARFGGSLGAFAGPVGFVVGAGIGAAICYSWRTLHSST